MDHLPSAANTTANEPALIDRVYRSVEVDNPAVNVEAPPCCLVGTLQCMSRHVNQYCCFACCRSPKRCAEPPTSTPPSTEDADSPRRRLSACQLLSLPTCLPQSRLRNENLLVLSIIQVLCGIASIILTAVSLTRQAFLYQIGIGMWAGLFMIAAGCQGLLTARRTTKLTVICLLLVSSVATLSSCMLIFNSVAGIVDDGFSQSAISQPPVSQHHLLRDGHLVFNHSDFVTLSNSSTMRTSQVILHLLLILVGVFEAAVSLLTVLICWRSDRRSSWSDRCFPQQPPGTNIIAFNSATASRAAAILAQSTEPSSQMFLASNRSNYGANHNVLLAVQSDFASSELNQQPSGKQQIPRRQHQPNVASNETSTDRPRPVSMPHPQIHHTALSFLPQSGVQSNSLSGNYKGPALLITNASTGPMAWAAVHAAASLVDAPDMSDSCEPVEPSSPPASRDRRRGRQLFRNSRRGRSGSRLLMTTVRLPKSDRPGTADPPGGTRATKQHCTLIYVAPSLLANEPPMIFPPFPPPFNEPGGESDTNDQLAGNMEDDLESQTPPRGGPHRRWYRRWFGSRARTTTSSGSDLPPVPRRPTGDPNAEMLSVNGDRLLQPVLIVTPQQTSTGCLAHRLSVATSFAMDDEGEADPDQEPPPYSA